MRNNRKRYLKLTTTAVFIALTCILTMTVSIPTPTKGYLNLGDCAVLIGGWLLGPLWGTVAGGLGSALADFFSGYPLYIPGTLLIKSLMALTAALAHYLFSGNKNRHPRAGFLIGAAFAETLMVAGYYLYEAVVIGEGFGAALTGVSGNVVQGIAGAAGAFLFVEILSRTDVVRVFGVSGFEKTRI